MEFHIKEIGDIVDLTPRTIRYYEKEGLLPPARRTHSGHRTFGAADVAALLRIKRLRSLGFGLEEIRKVLDAPGSEEAMGSLRELDARLRREAARIRAQRAAIAETLKSGAPLDIVPQFAEWFAARKGKAYSDADEDERDKIRLECVQAIGTEADRQRSRGIMRLQVDAPDDPLMAGLRDLDARFARVDAGTPPSDVEQLVEAYVEALTQLFTRVGHGAPLVESGLRSAALYDEAQADVVQRVMGEVIRRLNETEGAG